MDLTRLPAHSVPFTQEGFEKLIAELKISPEQIEVVKGALKENPRRLVYRLFDLTGVQRAVIMNMPDAQLHKYIEPIEKVDFHKTMEVEFKPDPICAGKKVLEKDLGLHDFTEVQYNCSLHFKN
jgi:hypothetical protein